MSLKVQHPSLRAPFFKREHGIDALRGTATGAAAVIGALKFFSDDPPNTSSGASLIFIAAALVMFDVLKYRIKDDKESGTEDLRALDAVVEAIAFSVKAACSPSQVGADVRMCIFVPDPNNAEFVYQLTNYGGSSGGSGKGRTVPVRSGVVGLAVRTGIPKFASPPARMETRDYLVELGFTKAEAENMSLERRAWAAVPIGAGPSNVLAILYADSDRQGFWGQTDDKKRKIMVAAALAVAKHITKP